MHKHDHDNVLKVACPEQNCRYLKNSNKPPGGLFDSRCSLVGFDRGEGLLEMGDDLQNQVTRMYLVW